MSFWAVMFVLFYGGALLLKQVSSTLQPFGDTLILAALGAACVVNYRRNRTLHCMLTAPLFLLAAAAAGLIETDIWRISETVLWAGVLFAVALAFIVEWRATRRHQALPVQEAAPR
jgi:hypothetical protein